MVSKVLGAGAITGLVVGFWSTIKLYFSKIISLFIVEIKCNAYLEVALSMLLNSEFKSSPIGTKNYTGRSVYVRSTKRNQIVAFETIPLEPTIWWRNRKPLLVKKEDGELVLSFIRGLYNRDKIIIEAINKFNDEKNDANWGKGDRFRIWRKYGTIGNVNKQSNRDNRDAPPVEAETPGFVTANKYISRVVGHNSENIGQPKNQYALDELSLDENAKIAISEAFRWRDSEEWFKERAIPWKRGWLLNGKPGTGKTAFTRALGQALNMPIIGFDLATMTNKDFSSAWEEAIGMSPCIVLFEDIDGVFKGRENIAVKGIDNGLTFDGFLNVLDGVENTDGIFIIITTNNIETIDDAIGVPSNGDGMSTRPGRIDRTIEFKALTYDGKVKMANRIMKGIPRRYWEHLLNKSNGDSGAQFQERCCRIALSYFWDNKQKEC